MNNLMKRIMSVAMAAITTTSPILSSYTIYASDITVSDDGTITQMSTSTDSSMSEADETKFLFIKLKTAGGKVVLNEGEDQEQRIRLDKKMDGAEYIDVYDKNDVLISSESTKDNGYTYVYEAKADDAVNVKAKADEGYTVKLYELTDDSSGTEIAEDVGFDAGNKVEAFKYPVFMEYDKTVKIGFEKKESAEDIAEDLSVDDDAGKDKTGEQSKVEAAEGKAEGENKIGKKDESESIKAEDVNADDSDKKQDGADSDEESENEDLTVDFAGAEVKDEGEVVDDFESSEVEAGAEAEAEGKGKDLTIDSSEDVNVDDVESDIENAEMNADSAEGGTDVNVNDDVDVDAKDDEKSVEDIGIKEPDVNAEETTKSGEHFTEVSNEISSLDADLFSSARLVIMTGNADSIVDTEHIIANYDNIYLMQYSTVEQAMTAYLYYSYNASTGVIDAVEPDAPIEAAGEEAIDGTTPIEETSIPVTEEANPINAIEEAPMAQTEDSKNVIALIDTGVSESANVIDRISLIGDELEGNGHGDKMLHAIVGQNANANVLSIRTMGNDGRGTVSSIIAGMEYALNHNVSIINLSLASKTNMANSVLAAEIEKAVNAGVQVVGAAGNNNADVKDYMPGSVSSALIIGAANEDGTKLQSSNYGDTVDYNVVAESTSEAAAKFSGFMSTGIDIMSVINVGGLIYQTDYEAMMKPETPSPSPDVDDKDIPETEPEDAPWVIGDYPEAYTTEYEDEKIYTRDVTYDFIHYNPYDDNVTITCDTPDVTADFTKDAVVEYSYSCKLNDNPDYRWTLDVIFTMVNDKEMATAYSKDIDKIFPSVICQERNKGYGGIVPEHVGDTVEGRSFNVLADTEDFDVEGLIQDYNPHTFKINSVDMNGFDIHTPGTYTVTYEMSYFMYFNYTWFVRDTINVIDPDDLEPGIYLTSKESTLLFTTGDGVSRGYGEFIKADEQTVYTLSSVSEEYTAGIVSSDSDINASEYSTITDIDAKLKSLKITVPDVDHVVVFSLERPGYSALKVFAGGGWKPPTLSEGQMADLKDFDAYEQELLKMSDEDLDEYMEVAASGYKTVAHVTDTCKATTGTDYQGMGTSWGRAHLYDKRQFIYNWVKKQGYTMDINDICDIDISCISGYDYKSWPANTNVTCKLDIYVQVNEEKKSFRVRVVVTADRGSAYQVFKGTDYYSADADTGWIVVRKRMADAELADFTNLIGDLYTTFTVYTDSACKDVYKVLRINAKEVDPTDGYVSYKVRAKADVDNYWVKETYTINGTVYNEEVYGPIPVIKGKDADVGAILKDDSRYHNIGKTGWIYNKPFYFTGDILVKKGAGNKNLEGAVFRVQYSEKNFNSFTSKRTWYLKTDSKGKLKFDNDHYLKTWTDEKGSVHKSGALLQRTSNGTYALPIGYLRVKEMQAPKGYALNKNTFDIELKSTSVTNIKLVTYVDGKQETLNVIDPTLDKKWTAQVKLKKIDENGKGLKGAIFGVYDNESCTGEPIGQLESEDNGETGILLIDNIPWDNETYTVYCREKEAPSGYSLTDEKFSITFKRADFEELYAKDPDTKGKLEYFGKESGIPNEKGWTVRVNAKKIDNNKKGLADAEFTVYKMIESGTVTQPDGAISNAQLKEVGKLVSGEDGITNELSIGISDKETKVKLLCRETKAPEGFAISKESAQGYILTFEKTAFDALYKTDKNTKGELKTFGPADGIENLKGTPTPTPVITQPPTPEPPTGSGLHIKKVSKAPEDVMALNSYTLKGAVFRVTSSRDGDMGTLTTDESGYTNTLTLPDNSTKEWVPAATDKDGNVTRPGYWQINEVTTTYYISEITPPNYHENNYQRQSITVTMPKDADTTFEVTFEDVPKFNKGSSLDIEKLGVKGEPIEGVVFKVEYFDGEDDSDDPVRTWHIKTKKDGHAKLDNSYLDPSQSSDSFYVYDGNIVIPIGGYLKITEEAAPAEYVLDDTPIGVKTVEGADFKFTYANNKAWYNELQRCRVDLQKFRADGTTPIAGVEFEIKFLEAAIQPTSKKHPNFRRLLNVGETTVRHTDSEGKVFFDNLDQGTYQITEIKTEPENALLKEPIILTLPFTMTRDEAIQYGNVDFSSAKEDIGYTNKWYFYSCKYDITNNAIFKMPMTGDDGKWTYGFIGFGMATALITTWLVYETKNKKTKKRKHKK